HDGAGPAVAAADFRGIRATVVPRARPQPSAKQRRGQHHDWAHRTFPGVLRTAPRNRDRVWVASDRDWLSVRLVCEAGCVAPRKQSRRPAKAPSPGSREEGPSLVRCGWWCDGRRRPGGCEKNPFVEQTIRFVRVANV